MCFPPKIPGVPQAPPRPGFTLLELLIVVAIIGVLAAMLVPAAWTGLEYANSVACRNNLRQMTIAMQDYLRANDGIFPTAYRVEMGDGVFKSVAWDFTTIKDWNQGGKESVEVGLLWKGFLAKPSAVHQCPSFRGAHNWYDDPFTGYNYNTDYLGSPARPASRSEVRNPARCAMFGDAGYVSGANKFMRAPFPPPPEFDDGLSPAGRAAGTQAFRHLGRANIAFVDGHVESVETPYTRTDPAAAGKIAPDTGFLSSDNRMYSLDGR
jgi:prepilin-type N-terminal cleavage/methylation domain-containing protein/prepilin-type processing-associated H-X9-DG protein